MANKYIKFYFRFLTRVHVKLLEGSGQATYYSIGRALYSLLVKATYICFYIYLCIPVERYVSTYTGFKSWMSLG